jgi:hypothetical protein
LWTYRVLAHDMLGLIMVAQSLLIVKFGEAVTLIARVWLAGVVHQRQVLLQSRRPAELIRPSAVGAEESGSLRLGWVGLGHFGRLSLWC